MMPESLNSLKSYRWMLLGLLLWMGCGHGLPEAEYADMQNLQLSWMQLLQGAEAKFEDIAEHHNQFMIDVNDTSNGWRRTLIAQDTALHIRIDRLSDSFERASRRHLFQLKELRSFLESNEIWLMRIQVEGAPRRAIRGSWDARSTQFKTKMDRILKAQVEFQAFGPEYEQLSKRIPGMSDASPAMVAPQPAPNAPVHHSPRPLFPG